MSSVKRIKVAHEADEDDMSSDSHHDIKHIQDLPTDVFQHCLEFVGKGNFAFVAPVSKHFYWNYINLGVEMKNNVIDVDVILQQGKNRRTTAKDVATGSLRLATECFLTAPKTCQEQVCRQAAVSGRLEILKCAVAFGVKMASVFPYHIADGTALNYDTFVQLAEIVANGHLEVIDFLHDEGIILDFYVLLKMFDRCKATSLHSMVSKGIFTEYRHCVFNCLITDGEIDILKESYKAFLSDMDECTFRCCAEGGNIEVMNWLLQQHECEWTLGLFRCAAKSGNIQMMELCLRNGCPSGEILYASALENKNKETALDTLIWLHEHNIPWHECVCQFAAKHGNLKALRWARENGCPWNEDTFNYAAQYGTIEILDYCFENNCPVDHNDIYHFPFFDRELKPTESDLQERSLKVYKWLFQHSIPWSDEAGMLAAHEGHLATLMWAVENGCPWHDDILGYAIGSYDISIVKYCVEHLSSIDETVYVLAMEKMNKTHERRVSDVTDIQMIKMLQIFRDYGVPWSRDIISNAERIGRSNVANWLRCVGCPE